MIKIITFCIGVDILGFPLFHKHQLKYKQENLYKIGYDPASPSESFSIGVSYDTRTKKHTVLQRKHLDK